MTKKKKTVGAKSPDPIDVHVGQRLRMRRIFLGMSQEELGKKLGVKFQQVQKYEKGTNRLGASRLQKASAALDVPVSYFFEDMVANGKTSGFSEETKKIDIANKPFTSEGLKLIKHFTAIKKPEVRRKILDLVKTLAQAK